MVMDLAIIPKATKVMLVQMSEANPSSIDWVVVIPMAMDGLTLHKIG